MDWNCARGRSVNSKPEGEPYLPDSVRTMSALAKLLKDAPTAPTAIASAGCLELTVRRESSSKSWRWKTAASASRAICEPEGRRKEERDTSQRKKIKQSDSLHLTRVKSHKVRMEEKETLGLKRRKLGKDRSEKKDRTLVVKINHQAVVPISNAGYHTPHGNMQKLIPAHLNLFVGGKKKGEKKKVQYIPLQI